MVKVFTNNCYVSGHILYSECPPLADTLISVNVRNPTTLFNMKQ